PQDLFANDIQALRLQRGRAYIRRVAGCATPTGSAGHVGATANLKLTFHLDHSAGADQTGSARALENEREHPKLPELREYPRGPTCSVNRAYRIHRRVACALAAHHRV